MDANQFIAGFVGDAGSPVAELLARAAADDRRAEAREQAEAAERDARRQQRAEEVQLLNHQLGDPMGELSRARQVMSEAGDVIADLEAQLEKARARYAQAEDRAQFWANRMQPLAAAAQRSQVPSDPVEAAVYRAHQEFKEHTSAMRVAAAARVARPKGQAGSAVRNEPGPVTCAECLAMDPNITAAESFAIHHMGADGQVLSESPDRPPPALVPDDAEQRSSGGYEREISRLVAAGYSPGTARMACQPLGRVG
jgi:hypothetical protein